MSTKKISISLPTALHERVEAKWRAAGYTSLSAYLQALVRRDLDQGDGVIREPIEAATLAAIKENTAAISLLIQRLSEISGTSPPAARSIPAPQAAKPAG